MICGAPTLCAEWKVNYGAVPRLAAVVNCFATADQCADCQSALFLLGARRLSEEYMMKVSTRNMAHATFFIQACALTNTTYALGARWGNELLGSPVAPQTCRKEADCVSQILKAFLPSTMREQL
jgi:hypothetical protein